MWYCHDLVCDSRRGSDWLTDLLTTYTHHLELQVIKALSLICTLYESPQHPLSLFAACRVFVSRSLTTASNSGDSSASRAQVLSSQPPVQTRLSTDYFQAGYHFTPTSYSSHHSLTLNWVSLGHKLVTRAIGHILTAHEPHSLTADSRLTESPQLSSFAWTE
jgi:hypothetical protein